MAERIWPDVPYAEKDHAKKAGARCDPAAERWYAARSGMAPLEPWAAAPDVPDLLPGEDRTLGRGSVGTVSLFEQRPDQKTETLDSTPHPRDWRIVNGSGGQFKGSLPRRYQTRGSRHTNRLERAGSQRLGSGGTPC
ncbi:DUF5710 domain-containing protein [Streptomyces sp. NPDC056682]|uniref:DUF5710 domain-containing protein n=1 Tax=Streptomyces sp. NPDC056682 TaxID=3345909 RepID=UPI0036A7FF0F